MLNEIDLVDVASADRLAHGIDRNGVVRLGPGSCPRPDRRRCVIAQNLAFQICSVAIGDNIVVRTDDTCEQRQRAGLWWRRRLVSTDRLRKPVSEVQLRDESLSAGGEEPVPEQPFLQPAKCAVGLMKLEC
jgi:hypothetical protein